MGHDWHAAGLGRPTGFIVSFLGVNAVRTAQREDALSDALEGRRDAPFH
jgi:hypothetical protein